MSLDYSQYWKMLAHAQYLSPDVFTRVWNSRVPAARVALASRKDVDDAISSEIVSSGDVALIRAWSSDRSRKPEHLRRLLENCPADELILGHVARQDALTDRDSFALLSAGSESVASFLLQRTPALPQHFRVRAGEVMASGRVYTGWHSVTYLVDIVGNAPDVWIAMLSVAPAGSSAVPLAALEACPRDVAIARAVLGWWERHGVPAAEDCRQDTTRAMDALLRCYRLSERDFRRASLLAVDHIQVSRAQALTAINPRAAVDSVLAGCTDKALFSRLNAAAIERVELPLADLFLVGLRASNRSEVSQELEAMRSRLLGPGSGEVLSRLLSEGDVELAVEFVEWQGSLLWLEDDMGPCPVEFVEALSRSGSQALLRSALAAEYASCVAENYTPLPGALVIPEVASCVLERLEEFAAGSDALLDTALVLLGQWQGSFSELCRASQALAVSGS